MEEHKTMIRDLVLNLRYTHEQVRDVLVYEHNVPPYGMSPRSVRRFCRKHRISRTVQAFPVKVRRKIVGREYRLAGPDCGRTFVQGRLQGNGFPIGVTTTGKDIKVIDPEGTEARYNGAKVKINPPIYMSDYAGQKIHFDQNEKMVMFGVTHVVAIDGYSRQIVGYSTMPVKNNLTIYEEVYRPAVLKHGMWDHLRVDQGQEFRLIAYAQYKYSLYRFDQTRIPVKAGKSIQNHTAERCWPEVNTQVNYPIKPILVNLWHNEIIDMDDATDKYLVSALTRDMAAPALKRWAVGANNRFIEGRGVPNLLARQVGQEQGRIPRAPLDMAHAPELAQSYREELGGRGLTIDSRFGRCSFDTPAAEEEWWARVRAAYPCTEPIWTASHRSQIKVKNYYVTALNLAEQVIHNF